MNDVSGSVNTFIEALKGQPLSLALVLMNLGLLGFLYYQGNVAAKERHAEMELLYRNRSEVGQLLANCYPGPPRK